MDKDSVEHAVQDVNCIIYLAAIIPPFSEEDPEHARSVNIEETRNLVRVAEKLDSKPKLVYASSVSTFGHTMHLDPPRKADEPLVAMDIYTKTKIECEKIVKESTLPWTILRFTAVPPLTINKNMDSMLFDILLDQRFEFVHTRDVGLACANTIEANTTEKTLLIGGGKTAQMLQKEFISRMMEAMGIGMLPESAFKVAKKPDEYFYTDWVDTEESQRLLKFQTRTYEDYINDLKKQLGAMQYVTKLFRPLARSQILAASPYYKRD